MEFGYHSQRHGELEDLGLLEQPHTSAGRVPTGQGYRYYVDNMLDSTRLSRTDLKAIESIGFGTKSKRAGSPDGKGFACAL